MMLSCVGVILGLFISHGDIRFDHSRDEGERAYDRFYCYMRSAPHVSDGEKGALP